VLRIPFNPSPQSRGLNHRNAAKTPCLEFRLLIVSLGSIFDLTEGVGGEFLNCPKLQGFEV
jgi:hypothetical protein